MKLALLSVLLGALGLVTVLGIIYVALRSDALPKVPILSCNDGSGKICVDEGTARKEGLGGKASRFEFVEIGAFFLASILVGFLSPLLMRTKDWLLASISIIPTLWLQFLMQGEHPSLVLRIVFIVAVLSIGLACGRLTGRRSTTH